MTEVSAQALAEIAQGDTPTICNALELVVPERRGHGFTKAPFTCLYPDMPPTPLDSTGSPWAMV